MRHSNSKQFYNYKSSLILSSTTIIQYILILQRIIKVLGNMAPTDAHQITSTADYCQFIIKALL